MLTMQNMANLYKLYYVHSYFVKSCATRNDNAKVIFLSPAYYMTLYAKPTVASAYVTVYCTHQQHSENEIKSRPLQYKLKLAKGLICFASCCPLFFS